MPALTIGSNYPPIADATTAVADVNDWFYDPAAPDEALSIINGYLDYDNIQTGLNLSAEHTQRGSHIYGQKASGTANLDYRWTWFGEWTIPTPWTVLDYDPYQPIPGGCTSLYVKWTSRVLVLWTVFWMNDNNDTDAKKSAIFLMVDGVEQGSQVRTVGKADYGAAPVHDIVGYEEHRSWSGHAWVSVSPGWHDFGLCILANAAIRNTRVYARSIIVVPFKNHGGGEGGV